MSATHEVMGGGQALCTCNNDIAYYWLTVIGLLDSLVSVRVSAPPFTANGVLVSEVTCANANTCAVSSAIPLELVVGGGVVVVELFDEPLLSPPHAANILDAVQIAPRIRTLDFMAYSS
jgi:hypothetical protein